MNGHFCMACPWQSLFATCNFGWPAQKSILHACYSQGTHKFVAHDYQVTFELYRNNSLLLLFPFCQIKVISGILQFYIFSRSNHYILIWWFSLLTHWQLLILYFYCIFHCPVHECLYGISWCLKVLILVSYCSIFFTIVSDSSTPCVLVCLQLGNWFSCLALAWSCQ